MTEPVKFEIAKLLIQKGYDAHPDFKDSYPTIAEVVMGLYEKYGIWIEVVHRSKLWGFSIKNTRTDLFELERLEYSSLTEAYEAAIEYVLNKLI